MNDGDLGSAAAAAAAFLLSSGIGEHSVGGETKEKLRDGEREREKDRRGETRRLRDGREGGNKVRPSGGEGGVVSNESLRFGRLYQRRSGESAELIIRSLSIPFNPLKDLNVH